MIVRQRLALNPRKVAGAEMCYEWFHKTIRTALRMYVDVQEPIHKRMAPEPSKNKDFSWDQDKPEAVNLYLEVLDPMISWN